ncbi:uncharacterized protein LOC127864581 isoform X1 [Dreissena polymorpha]|nr:uncharacterized protein LOC127864581 isoform X1 [Dreissena polymorpha]XP_052260281.1 uncharacterized protein LOC127864581 isoform X1 [Dreissena polymorpha]
MSRYQKLTEDTAADVEHSIPPPQCREHDNTRPDSPHMVSGSLQGTPDPPFYADAHLYEGRLQRHVGDGDDDDDHIGSIQYPSVAAHDDEPLFSKHVPLLLKWPFYYGIIEIVLGFLTVLFSVAYIFMVQDWTSTVDTVRVFNSSNSYGAMLWSGVVLILAGSLAVRICKTKSRKNIILFYIFTLLGTLLNLSLSILTISCLLSTNNTNTKYVALYGLSIVCCNLGYIPLLVTAIKYLLPVCLGRVRLGHALLVCWLPCCFSPESPSHIATTVLTSHYDDMECLVI